MPLNKKDQDKAIIAQLLVGKKPLEIHESCKVTEGLEEVPLSRIYSISRAFNKDTEKDLVPDLAELPIEVVQAVVDDTRDRVMLSNDKEKGALLGALTNVFDAKQGLDNLNRSFQRTVMNTLEVFDKHLSNPELPLKDVRMIMDTVSKAHMDIFSSTTNIHIGDNNTDNKKQSIFQSEMRS